MYHTPEKVLLQAKVVKISAGQRHSMAVDVNNKLWGWGINSNRQLGTGNTEHCKKPELIWNIESVKEVSCGATHTVAIDTKSHLWVWGEDKVHDDQADIALPMALLRDNKFVSVFAGTGLTYAIEGTTMKLYVWGVTTNNSRIPKTLAEKAKEGLLKPTVLSLENEVKASQIVCGAQHTLLLEKNGDILYGWGNATGGRLGVSESIVEAPKKLLNLDDREDHEDEANAEEDNLQEHLVNEPEEQKERFLLESDQLLMKDFASNIEDFLEIISDEREEEIFFEEAGRKMLSRIASPPFKAKIQMKCQDSILSEISRHVSMLISTFQLHPCYVYNALVINSNYQNILNTIYIDMQDDSRLIYAALLLSRRLLEKALVKATTDSEIKYAIEETNYHYLVNMILKASVVDMATIREIVFKFISIMISKISDDRCGIVTDPIKARKSTAQTQMNAINAYINNKKTVDRRVENLRGLIDDCLKELRSNKTPQNLDNIEFSDIPTFILRDLFNQLRVKQTSMRIEDTSRPSVRNFVKFAIFLLFEELFKAIEDPINYSVVIELNTEEHKDNLISLSSTLRAVLLQDVSSFSEKWMRKFKVMAEDEAVFTTVYGFINTIYQKEVNLDKELMLSLFKHSLRHYDIQVNVPYEHAYTLSNICRVHVDKIRINTGKYDPIVLINKSTNALPRERPEEVPPGINVTLLTRCLRHEQSLVRCPICRGIIVREMAPTTYEQVFKLFEPMPPTAPVAMLSEIFVKGPRKSETLSLEDYLTNFRESCTKGGIDLKTASIIESIKNAVEMQVVTESSRAISEGIQAKLSKEVIDKVRKDLFGRLQKECFEAYLSRTTHFTEADVMRANLDAVRKLLRSHKQDQGKLATIKQKLMFNLEYGASNREVQKYSDGVMFRIFMLKVQEYTEQRPMSIQLFENLKDDMTKNLKAFSKLSLKSLKSNRTISEIVSPTAFDYNHVEVSIEQVDDGYTFVFFQSPKGMLVGESRMKEDKVFGYHKLLKRKIIDLSNKARLNSNDTYVVELLNGTMIHFNTDKLVKLIDKIDSQVIIYGQNAQLASENRILKGHDEADDESDIG